MFERHRYNVGQLAVAICLSIGGLITAAAILVRVVDEMTTSPAVTR